MSGNNSLAGEITLDELERLIRILGMLGSSADGEVLNAARLAQRWVAEKGTDWRTLLTPEPEMAVTGVVAQQDPAALAAERAQAAQENYRKGYKAGLDAMAAQVKAQAAYASPTGHAGTRQQTAQAMWGTISGQTPQPPPAASPGQRNTYPTGTWQWVAQELLDRSDAGIPGVFRGSRESGFVSDILARGFPNLTQAQENWLRSIASRSGLSW